MVNIYIYLKESIHINRKDMKSLKEPCIPHIHRWWESNLAIFNKIANGHILWPRNSGNSDTVQEYSLQHYVKIHSIINNLKSIKKALIKYTLIREPTIIFKKNEDNLFALLWPDSQDSIIIWKKQDSEKYILYNR